MMFGHPALQSELHLRNLFPKTPPAKVGQLSAIFLAVQHLVQDDSPGYAQPITGHRCQLDVCVFQNLLHAIGNCGVILP